MPFSRGSSQPKDGTQISGMPGSFFNSELPVKTLNTEVGSLALLQGIFLTQEQILDFIKRFFSIYQDDPTVFHFQIFSKIDFQMFNECYTHGGQKPMDYAMLHFVYIGVGCHRSAVSLSALNVSPLIQTITPMWGLETYFSSPTHQGQVQAYQHSMFFPASSFIPPSFVVLCILFHWSGTPVSSQLVNCKHF